MELVVLALASAGTALATGLGAIPVSRLGRHKAALQPALWGLTVGCMTVASVVGLLLPALDEGSPGQVAGGLVAGVAFLFVSRAVLDRRDVHVAGIRGAGARRSVLVFAVLLVHSLPEGFAIGTAFASNTKGLSLFVLLAIALQNVPEGTSVAIPMEDAGFDRRHQFWAAVLTSAPQPLGALFAYGLVQEISSLLPVSFGFAAGAMLALVGAEVAPQAFAPGHRGTAIAGTALGAGVVLALATMLGV